MSDSSPAPGTNLPYASGRDGMAEAIGLEVLSMSEDEARGRVPMSPTVQQPMGVVNGAVYSVVAETLCSVATARSVIADGMVAMGQSNTATFLRPITKGDVNARAYSRHRGRTSWVWDVEITDDEERLCALVRMVVAVRPAPPELLEALERGEPQDELKPSG